MADLANAVELNGSLHYFTPECDESRWRADPNFCARPTTNGAIGTFGDVWVHVVPRNKGATVSLNRRAVLA